MRSVVAAVPHKAPSSSCAVIITGASRGLGYETALQLGVLGLPLVLAVRNLQCSSVVQLRERLAAAGNSQVHAIKLDLSSFSSIRTFVQDLDTLPLRYGVLINNAGVLRWKGIAFTAEGFEEHIGANFFGHFLLTQLALPLLQRNKESRVITLSSHLAASAIFQPNRLNAMQGFEAYSASKLGNWLMGLHAQLLHSPAGTTFITVDPGTAATSIVRHMPFPDLVERLMNVLPLPGVVSAAVGAAPSVLLATMPQQQVRQFAGQIVRSDGRRPIGLALRKTGDDAGLLSRWLNVCVRPAPRNGAYSCFHTSHEFLPSLLGASYPSFFSLLRSQAEPSMDQRREEAAQLWQLACSVTKCETKSELQRMQASIELCAVRYQSLTLCTTGGYGRALGVRSRRRCVYATLQHHGGCADTHNYLVPIHFVNHVLLRL
jgi:NAD(P)-dependent dehydrogenase (short-subunit alcohol dehydrogenase family)